MTTGRIIELDSHVPGTPYEWKHGWIPVGPEAIAEEAKRGTRAARRRARGETGRAKVQTPSQFRHPDTGHLMGKSEIGDTFEEMFAQQGEHLLRKRYGTEPYVPVAHAKGEGGLTSRSTALDFRLGSKYGGELKTLNVHAKNQKTAIKKEEQQRKLLACAKANLSPLLAVQVVDMENGTVKVYTYPGFVSKKVSMMEPVGSYSFSPADFKKAQQKTGHWDKRFARAGIKLARSDVPPEDPEPQPGDTVIELINGVPHIYTQPEEGESLK